MEKGWDISTYIRVCVFFYCEIRRMSVDYPRILRDYWADQGFTRGGSWLFSIRLRCSVSSLFGIYPAFSNLSVSNRYHLYISRVLIFGVPIMRASLAIRLPASALLTLSLVLSFSLCWIIHVQTLILVRWSTDWLIGMRYARAVLGVSWSGRSE